MKRKAMTTRQISYETGKSIAEVRALIRKICKRLDVPLVYEPDMKLALVVMCTHQPSIRITIIKRFLSEATSPGYTITTHKLAQITGKEHYSLFRDVEAMARLLGSWDGIELLPHQDENRRRKEPNSFYRLDGQQALCLLLGYNTKTKMKVIEQIWL